LLALVAIHPRPFRERRLRGLGRPVDIFRLAASNLGQRLEIDWRNRVEGRAVSGVDCLSGDLVLHALGAEPLEPGIGLLQRFFQLSVGSSSSITNDSAKCGVSNSSAR